MLWLNTRMDPYQQYQAPTPGGNPYEFIMNPGKPPKKKIGLGGGNFMFTLILIIGGAIIFMIILAIIANSIGGSKFSKSDLIGMAQTEQELSRVSQAASTNATQQTTKNFAVTIQFTMITQQQRVLALLKKNGVKVGTKELALKQNATTDQQLASAKSTSTYDLTYSQLMQTQLTDYANAVKTLNGKAASKAESDMTSDFYTQTQLLISQIPYAQNAIQNGASAGQ